MGNGVGEIEDRSCQRAEAMRKKSGQLQQNWIEQNKKVETGQAAYHGKIASGDFKEYH